MHLFSCICGGIIELLILGIVCVIPWVAKKLGLIKVCKGSCKCSCHKFSGEGTMESPWKLKDDGDRPGFGGVDKDGNQFSGTYPYYKDEHTMAESPVTGCHCRMCESARAAKQ